MALALQGNFENMIPAHGPQTRHLTSLRGQAKAVRVSFVGISGLGKWIMIMGNPEIQC